MRIRPKYLAMVAVLATATTLVSACSEEEPEAKTTKSDSSYSAGDLKLDSRPEKIVSMSATATEMLFAMDAGEQVEAVDVTSNYPDNVPKTDLDAFKPNVEAISGYEPDLVVLSNDQEGIVDKLKKVKIPVFVAPAASSLDDTYKQITDLGSLTGHNDDAETLNTNIEADMDKIVKGLSDSDDDLSVYYELDSDYYSLTSDTFAGNLLDKANLHNIADKADDAAETGGYPQLSAESVIDEDPDIIFVAAGGKDSVTDLKKRDGFDSVSAVKKDNVVALNEDLASRWGPRVVDLMTDISDAVKAA